MFKELNKITVKNSFSFSQDEQLDLVCNAPENASGIFLVYAIENGQKELIMVASTGTVQNNGSLKSKNGGLYDKIVNGHQFAKTGRKYSWPAQMKLENIDTLEIFWYDTFNENIQLIPTSLEGQILQEFFDEHKKLPRWNVAF